MGVKFCAVAAVVSFHQLALFCSDFFSTVGSFLNRSLFSSGFPVIKPVLPERLTWQLPPAVKIT